MVEEDTTVLIFFRFFQDDEQQGSKDVCIPLDHLKCAPQSLLTTLADERWQADPSMGKSKAKPISISSMTSSPCKEQWSPPMADAIRNAYKYLAEVKAVKNDQGRAHQKATVKILVPQGVEVEDLMVVLDYFNIVVRGGPLNGLRGLGWRIENAYNNWDVLLRANLFCKQVNLAIAAMKTIFDEFFGDPCREKFFLFAERSDSDEIIQKHNREPLVRIGKTEKERQNNLKWVVERRMRVALVSELELKGLEATFDVQPPADCYGQDTDFDHLFSRHMAGEQKTWVACTADARQSFEPFGPSYGLWERYVLHVRIPPSPSKKRKAENLS